jgi:hypothetical protein
MLFERSETLDTSVTDAVLTWTCLTVHLFDVAGKTVSPRRPTLPIAVFREKKE